MIESITSIREPQPEFEALYLVMPTTQNVDRIIRDFSNQKQYAAAHLFFLEGASWSAVTDLAPDAHEIQGLPEPLFERLTSSPAEPHLQALKELFLNFNRKLWSKDVGSLYSSYILAIEAQVFSMREPSYFFSMYSPPRTDASFKPARARLEEDLWFMSKMVSTG